MTSGTTCPDCGGIIGGDPNGVRPACQCELNLTMDDTQVEAQPAPAAEAAEGGSGPAVATKSPPPGAKICCQCGKDVTHARRAKDARGYWCYECHRNDLRRERAAKPRTRCPECGRLVPAESIATLHGNPMCAKCRVDQENLPRHMQAKYRRKDDPAAKEEVVKKEKKRIIALAVIFGILVLIIIIGRFL